jgi:dolichol-phosphate mannosyltransferase
MRAAIVIPTYNESDNIQSLVEAIIALGEALQVIIVDDSSPDGTGELAENLAREHSAVHVLHRSAKLGLGTAYIAGFKRAFALGAERIMTMDADFSHHPRYIPRLLARSQAHDLVIGSRYVDGGGTLHCGLWRQVLSRTANTVARIVLGLRAHDCTAGFRCYRRQALESIGLDHIFSDGYSFLVEMLYKCQQRGCRIAEVPIIFEDRRRGASKISRQEIFKAMYTVFRLRWEKDFNRPFPHLENSKRSSWNT